ncbi:MAG: hypothetical protein JW745_09070 [Sedimentisphaerales bacterium]|nr:hypothetical protein [Sedimentisphaerales bacterium]MBN2843157.1 hypothetical protein [Sedimentisphaerales bacterium]
MDKKTSIPTINTALRAIMYLLVIILTVGCTSSSGVRKDHCNCFPPAELLFKPAFCQLRSDTQGNNTGIELFIQVTDEFGDSIKLPGIFRIEIYERLGLNQDKTGERLIIDNNSFKEIDLRDPVINHQHWDKITNCYRLSIDRTNLPNELVVQATWFYDQNYRLANTISLKTENK